jgi:hypothetical protein
MRSPEVLAARAEDLLDTLGYGAARVEKSAAIQTSSVTEQSRRVRSDVMRTKSVRFCAR